MQLMSEKPLIHTRLLSAAAYTAVQDLMQLIVICQIPTKCMLSKTDLVIRQKHMVSGWAWQRCRLLMARLCLVMGGFPIEISRMALSIVKATWVTHQREGRLHQRPDLVQ